MTNFQIALTGIFVFFIVLGVILFAGFKGNNATVSGNVVIWGTLDQNIINNLLNEIKNQDTSFKGVSYKQISNADNFDSQLAEAMASGKGPDAFFLPQYSILKNKDKIVPISFNSFPLRDFKDRFIEEGELYLTNEGILALPFMVDPLVMYWNRDIFTRAGIANPPKNWDEFFSLSGKITKKDSNLNILKSAVSFGEFRNVNNAKEIISALIMQAGSPITARRNSYTESVLGMGVANTFPAEEAVDFYTQFSNPVKPVYSWNRSLDSSEKSFLAGDLAVYFGFASELNTLRAKNPNLNFDVTNLPQVKQGSNTTFGKMIGIAIAKSSLNPQGAFNALMTITNDTSLSLVSGLTNLPPVSRTLLSTKPIDPYFSVFYDSALLSKGWLDPNYQETNNIFQEMVESIESGKYNVHDSVQKADSDLGALLQN